MKAPIGTDSPLRTCSKGWPPRTGQPGPRSLAHPYLGPFLPPVSREVRTQRVDSPVRHRVEQPRERPPANQGREKHGALILPAFVESGKSKTEHSTPPKKRKKQKQKKKPPQTKKNLAYEKVRLLKLFANSLISEALESLRLCVTPGGIKPHGL